MAIQWTTTQQQANTNGVKMMVYGDSGTGKTVLCATAPTPIIISAESGLLSLSQQNLTRLYGANNPSITYNAPVAQVSSVETLLEVYRWCATSTEARQYATVCIDSLSEIGEVILANAKKQYKDPRQAYGELIERAVGIVKAFRDLPGFHVYVSAKSEPYKDDFTGITRFFPSMPGSKLGPQLGYFFDELFRIGTAKDAQGKKYRYLHTDSEVPYVAKDRSGLLDEYEMPHLTHVINKIQGVAQ